MSDIHQGLLGCRGTNLSTFSTRVQARRVMSLQRPVPAFSDAERARSRSTRCCGSARREVCSRRAWTAQQGLPLGSKQGAHGFLVPARDPWSSSAKTTRPHVVFGPVATNRETDALVPSTRTTGAL
jgi:hypothetical protein